MRGYKTRCKSEIKKFIHDNKHRSFTIFNVHEYLANKGVNVDISTVYRNIKSLEKSGVLVGKKHPEEDGITYQYQEFGESCKHHLHLHCKECGGIIHTDETMMDDITRYINKKCGYKLDAQNSTFMGVCNKCKDKE